MSHRERFQPTRPSLGKSTDLREMRAAAVAGLLLATVAVHIRQFSFPNKLDPLPGEPTNAE